MENNYLLELKNIYKNFGGVKALEDVSLGLNHNECLAVVGDNGAGKSTLMKIISGAIKQDAGEIYLEGEQVKINNPQDSVSLGIQMTYQDLALVDCLDIPKNLFLGRELCKKVLGFIDFVRIKKMREDSKHHLKNLGIEIDYINERVKNLSGGQRQIIAISRAVYWSTKIIILDEPTAALGVKESKKVLNLINGLKRRNLSVIVISHNLQHVFTIADRVLILRRGRKVGERPIKETDGDEVVKLITGAEFA